MRIIAFIQDVHSIKDIMKACRYPGFSGSATNTKVHRYRGVGTEAIDELPLDDSFDPLPDDL
jgi:hypothetical protein